MSYFMANVGACRSVETMERLNNPGAPPPASAADVYRQPDRAEIEALTEPQMLALLQMSKTVRAQAIWGELRQQYSAPPFTLSTFAELRRLGYADKPADAKFHRLSVRGFPAAMLAADILQERHNIHAAMILGATKATVTVMCSCKWSCGIVRGARMQLKAANAHSQHLLSLARKPGNETALAPVSIVETERG